MTRSQTIGTTQQEKSIRITSEAFPTNPSANKPCFLGLNNCLHPGFERKELNLLNANKICVGGKQRQTVVNGCGCNPKVILTKAKVLNREFAPLGFVSRSELMNDVPFELAINVRNFPIHGIKGNRL